MLAKISCQGYKHLHIYHRFSMTLTLRYILGLTSSDDDYVPPNPEDEIQLLAKLKSEGADTEVSKLLLSLVYT